MKTVYPWFCVSTILFFSAFAVSNRSWAQVASDSATASDTSTATADTEAANAGQWIQLFNGKDLEGWTPKFCTRAAGENYKDTFRVQDGILKVSYENWDGFNKEFGHLFYKDSFSHYRLRVEYRFVGQQVPGGEAWALRNNGLMIHGQTPQAMEVAQKFPNSIEVQLLGGNGTDPRSSLSVCTPGTHIVIDGKLIKKHCTSSNGPTFPGDDWVTVEVEVRGSDSIKHLHDGKVIMEYTQPQLDDGSLLESGTISIQAESHPTEFRKIELMVLSK